MLTTVVVTLSPHHTFNSDTVLLQSGTPFVDLAQMTAAADFFIFQAHLLDENFSSICLEKKSVGEIT